MRSASGRSASWSAASRSLSSKPGFRLAKRVDRRRNADDDSKAAVAAAANQPSSPTTSTPGRDVGERAAGEGRIALPLREHDLGALAQQVGEAHALQAIAVETQARRFEAGVVLVARGQRQPFQPAGAAGLGDEVILVQPRRIDQRRERAVAFSGALRAARDLLRVRVVDPRSCRRRRSAADTGTYSQRNRRGADSDLRGRWRIPSSRRCCRTRSARNRPLAPGPWVKASRSARAPALAAVDASSSAAAVAKAAGFHAATPERFAQCAKEKLNSAPHPFTALRRFAPPAPSACMPTGVHQARTLLEFPLTRGGKTY